MKAHPSRSNGPFGRSAVLDPGGGAVQVVIAVEWITGKAMILMLRGSLRTVFETCLALPKSVSCARGSAFVRSLKDGGFCGASFNRFSLEEAFALENG